MSETDVVDSIPVTKDPTLVNGDNGPHSPELTNGDVGKPVDMSNGVHHEELADMNGGDSGPVNGDMNGQEDEADLLGDDDLPPPPVSELPPPPSSDNQQDLLAGDNVDDQELVDDVGIVQNDLEDIESAAPDIENEVNDLVDVTEDVSGIVGVESVEVKPAMDISDEELVSDGGLKEEVDTEGQNNQDNEAVEQAGAQLVDFSEPEPVVCEDEAPVIPEPTEPLVPVGYEMVDVEMENLPEVGLQPEPVDDLSSPTDPEVTTEPVQELIQEPAQEPTQESVQELEQIKEPEPIVNIEVTQEEEMPEPEPVHESVPEPLQEVYKPEPEPLEVVPVEMEPPIPEVNVTQDPVCEVQPIPEVNITQEPDEEQPAVEQSQVGYAEPDIIVDNKPMEDEVPKEEVPPPPPPPLEEETPPPPPPLDENVPLKRDRRSGGSTPNKQSPSKEIVTPTAPVVIESVREPVPEPAPAPVVEAAAAGEDLSPPVSQAVVSEPAQSEMGQGEPVEPHTTVSPQVSQKINKKNYKNKIKFGVDLVEAALKQLSFLNHVNKEPGLFEEWLYKKAIRRYEAFWLPLAAEHKKEHLAAPLDIEWVWHCHLLAPLFYEADSKNLVGLTVEHKLMSEKDRTKSLEKSKKYWLAKYPNEPFEIDLVYKEKEPEVPVEAPVEASVDPAGEAKPAVVDAAPVTQGDAEVVEQTDNAEGVQSDVVAPTASEEDTNTEQSEDSKHQEPIEQTAEQQTEQATSEVPVEVKPAPSEPVVPVVPEEGYEQKSSYDIYSAIGRQRVFFYQVSLPHFHDKNFLKAAVKRYQRFLFLKHQNPTEVLAPCYDIDLIWHSHQLHPSVYKHDTSKVLGQILVHNDSINDRSVGSKLLRADQKTRDLWKTLFDDNFVAYGSTFRGEPPVLCEKMSLIEQAETFQFSTKKAMVNLDKVQVEGLPEEVNKYSVRLAYGAHEGEGPLIKQFKGNKKKIEFENIKKGLAHFMFDTKENERINFNMSQQIGFACTGHDEEIGQQWFNLMPVIENIQKSQQDPLPLTDTVTIDEESNLKATFAATIEPPKQGPTMLFLKNGNYETRFCIMPEQVVQMWGPIPLLRLPAGRDNHCVVASHKFLNHTGEVTFTCRVIHSLPLLMSAVQVFYHNRMAAVAHLVGSDQIPLPSQLSDSKKIFSLNPAEGQRAILIKNQTGDWGLIRGQWTGFRKAQPAIAATKGKKAKKEVQWNPGTLSVSFYKLGTSAWQHLSLPYQQDSYKFTIQDANVDLKTGTIQINSDSNEVAENLALSFSVALLHCLCQPRYTPPPPPQPIPVVAEQQAPPPEPVPVVAEQQPPAPTVTPPSDQPETPPLDEKPAEGEQDKVDEGGESAVDGASPESPAPVEPPVSPPVSPKSPTLKSNKSEPSTPSKKVKELPPIPTVDLGLVLAAGYNVEIATNDHISKQYGENACAGCVAYGMDVGVGQVGQVVEQVQEVEVTEAVETAEAGDNGGQDNIEMADGMEMDADGMDAGDMGDAGGAACGAF